MSAPYFYPKMRKKAQVLMIILWILVILTLLAVSIAYRVSLGLRLSIYQRERLKAHYLARAGINKAITEIEKDSPDCDSLKDKWADNKETFSQMKLGEDEEGVISISYIDKEEEKFGVRDEERKININKAPPELLTALLEKYAGMDGLKIADNIRAWRGDAGVAAPDYKDLDYTNKAAKFSNTQELVLVRDISPEVYNQLKESITVYGSGKLNINTVSDETLQMLVNSCIKKLENEGNNEREPNDLVERIIQLRNSNIIFGSISDLRTELQKQADLTSAQNNLINKLEGLIDTKSTCFFIISHGKINKISYTISCIFDRAKKEIIYWHES